MGNELRPSAALSQRSGGESRFCLVRRLPDASLDEDWSRIFVDQALKARLLRYVKTLSQINACRASPTGLALRRGVLLFGSSGVGKSSLARSTANETAKDSGRPTILVTANAAALASNERGGSQKNVLAFARDLGEIAMSGYPVFALFDEVESIGTNRASVNPDTNPLDTLFSVNSFIECLDELVRSHPNIILLFTTNIPRAVDRAITERVDFSVWIPLPDAETRRLIVNDAANELDQICGSDTADRLRAMLASEEANEFLQLTDGFSPRQLRHLIVAALTYAPTLESLTFAHVLQAAQAQRDEQNHHTETGGVYIHAYQQS